jgi:hypothetical protein
VAYEAAQRGSLPVRSPQVRPVHVADLLSREGHPLARSVLAARDKHDPQALVESSSFAPRRTLGLAAGAALVLGTVVAGAFGLNHGQSATPTAAGGEPVGALPGRGAPPPVQPGQVGPQSPAAPEQPQFVNTAATQNAPAAQAPTGPAGRIGIPAAVPPPPPAAPQPKPPVQQPKPPAPAQAAPQAPAPGPLQQTTTPVTNTVGGSTLTGAVAPVTSTLDNTLAPALSLIGGLLGH